VARAGDAVGAVSSGAPIALTAIHTAMPVADAMISHTVTQPASER
jgi:hypothetical protein